MIKNQMVLNQNQEITQLTKIKINLLNKKVTKWLLEDYHGLTEIMMDQLH